MSKNREGEFYSILLLGDQIVGKSCYLLRLTDNTFQDAYLMTMGYDYKIKHLTLPSGKKITTKIWDTVGQEKFKSLAKSYYKGADGIILLYDITNRTSFENIDNWMEQIHEKAAEDIQILLLGNKCDLEEERKITKEEGESLAQKYNLSFYETSVKNSINVTESFNLLAENLSRIGSKKMEQVKLKREKVESGGCCGKKDKAK